MPISQEDIFWSDSTRMIPEWHSLNFIYKYTSQDGFQLPLLKIAKSIKMTICEKKTRKKFELILTKFIVGMILMWSSVIIYQILYMLTSNHDVCYPSPILQVRHRIPWNFDFLILTYVLLYCKWYCFLRSSMSASAMTCFASNFTVKILKIGTPEIITIIVLQLEQLDFTVQYCVQKMQTE